MSKSIIHVLILSIDTCAGKIGISISATLMCGQDTLYWQSYKKDCGPDSKWFRSSKEKYSPPVGTMLSIYLHENRRDTDVTAACTDIL